MNLLGRLIRSAFGFFLQSNADFDRAVEILHREQCELPLITRNELAQVLEDLAKRKPKSKTELTQLEAELFVLGERIKKSEICNQVPHFIWHFLSDADIRFKEPDFSDSQVQTLQSCILELRSVNGTQPV